MFAVFDVPLESSLTARKPNVKLKVIHVTTTKDMSSNAAILKCCTPVQPGLRTVESFYPYTSLFFPRIFWVLSQPVDFSCSTRYELEGESQWHTCLWNVHFRCKYYFCLDKIGRHLWHAK